MASPDLKPQKRICIGKISSAHGVKGLVKILPFCEDINLLNGKLFTSEQGHETLNVTLKNSAGKFILAQIDGITNPEDAKALKCSLYVPREALPEIEDEDSFYIEDMIGLSVLNDEGQNIGTLIAVENFGAGDLLEVKPKSGAAYFVPFQSAFVGNIDIENNTITLLGAEQFIIE